jgi:hypothetical protein
MHSALVVSAGVFVYLRDGTHGDGAMLHLHDYPGAYRNGDPDGD